MKISAHWGLGAGLVLSALWVCISSCSLRIVRQRGKAIDAETWLKRKEMGVTLSRPFGGPLAAILAALLALKFLGSEDLGCHFHSRHRQ